MSVCSDTAQASTDFHVKLAECLQTTCSCLGCCSHFFSLFLFFSCSLSTPATTVTTQPEKVKLHTSLYHKVATFTYCHFEGSLPLYLDTGRSLMHARKSSSPRTIPCGTSDVTQHVWLLRVYTLASFAEEGTPPGEIVAPYILYKSSLCNTNRQEWGTLSKAVLNNRMMSTCSPLMRLQAIS